MSTNTNDEQFNESASGNIRIYFISAGKSRKDPCNVLLTKAFQALSDADMTPEWTDDAFCLSLKQRPRTSVFVLSMFEGRIFEHLRGLRCSIVGAGLILSCLQAGKSMPKTSHPVLSDCMEGIVACCSNIDQTERERIREKILSMKGRFEGSLSSDCTLLISTEVGTRKYKAAVKAKTISIVTPQFVDAVWKRSQTEVFQIRDDPEFLNRYKCPVFAGLTITVSNIKDRARKDIENLIVQNGGKFSGEMKQAETTHLVTDLMEGQKYKVARTWKQWPIYIVGTAWVHESVKRGCCLDEEEYLTDKLVGATSKRGLNSIETDRRQQKCSTPRVSSAAAEGRELQFNASGITAIAPDAPNLTVISDVSIPPQSFVNNTIASAAPDIFKRPAPYPIHEEGSSAEPTTSIVISNNEHQNSGDISSPKPASKRLRSVESKVVDPPSNAAIVQEEHNVTLPPVAQAQAEKASSNSPVKAHANEDVVSQYMNNDGQDPNATFRPPDFDFEEMLDYIEKAPEQKSAPPAKDSPSVMVERQINAAAAVTGAGNPIYNSPAALPIDDVRRSLAKRLQNVLGRASFKRNGSNSAFTITSTEETSSPTGKGSTTGSNNEVTPGPNLPNTQDMQETHVVVDWDDPNQKRERQKLSDILRKRNEPTQSVILNDIVNDCEIVEENRRTKEYIFQLTSVSQDQRNRYANVIKQLGGSVTELPNFDLNCTHLIAATPTRNEKLLAAIANGVWVLYVSYLDASETAGRFVEEADHEFGAPGTTSIIAKLRDEVGKLMVKCPHWRRTLQAQRGTKAYSGWNVLLYADKSKEDGLLRILTSGGAVVTKSLTEAKDGVITHVIVDGAKKPHSNITDVMKRLQRAGATCYKTDVLFAYLAGEELNDHLYRL